MNWVKGKAATKHAVMAVGVFLNKVPILYLMPDRPDEIRLGISPVGELRGGWRSRPTGCHPLFLERYMFHIAYNRSY